MFLALSLSQTQFHSLRTKIHAQRCTVLLLSLFLTLSKAVEDEDLSFLEEPANDTFSALRSDPDHFQTQITKPIFTFHSVNP